MAAAPVTEDRCDIPEGMRPDRADKLLARLLPQFSRSQWQKWFRAGHIWRDDVALQPKSLLRPGDVVHYSIPPAQPMALRPVPLPLVILYEDADLIVLNKKAGMVVHPGAGTGEDTLVHGLLHHCQGQLSGIGGVERPGIVHRLDKETSGILLVAKSDACFQLLAEQFASRSLRKFYAALVHGIPQPPSGTIDQPITRHPIHRLRMSCAHGGRPSATSYSILRSFGHLASRLHLQIHTGRTHQIRVHLQHIGHPILGDALYAGRRQDPVAVPRVMLHACRIECDYPAPGQRFAIDCPPPEDFVQTEEAMDALAGQSPAHSR